MIQNLPLNQEEANLTKDDKYCQLMKDMFTQINQSLLAMLRNLKYIYQAHGIFHNIDPFHSVILQMLMPPQLTSFLHFLCPHDQFREAAFNSVEPFKNWQITPKKIVYKKRDFNKYRRQWIKNDTGISNQPQREILQKNHSDSSGEYEQSASYNSDSELCDWILEEANKGRKLKRLDIIRRAILNGTIARLQGSSQWCNQFLSRNPTLKSHLILFDENEVKKQNEQSGSENNIEVDSKKQVTQHIQGERGNVKMEEAPISGIQSTTLEKKMDDVNNNLPSLQSKFECENKNIIQDKTDMIIQQSEEQKDLQKTVKKQQENNQQIQTPPKCQGQQKLNEIEQAIPLRRGKKPKRVRDVAGRYEL